MRQLNFTVVADGSSDAVLMNVIEWTIRQHRPDLMITSQFARDLGAVRSGLATRVRRALELYPCDVLFVHRDAESVSLPDRYREIEIAVGDLHPRWVGVVPLRMTEAWLLSDESAIRQAAGNRSGKVKLNLPPKRRWERLPNPKRVLLNALMLATEKSGRALASFSPERERRRVTQLTEDFSELRGLAAFDHFEKKVKEILEEY